MPINYAEIETFSEDFPKYKIVVKREDMIGNDVYGMYATISGIRGGKFISSIHFDYRLYLDLSNFPSEYPKIFITNLLPSQVRHINIWKERNCSRLGRSYPFLCIGSKTYKYNKISLDSTFHLLTQVLNSQNFESRAR